MLGVCIEAQDRAALERLRKEGAALVYRFAKQRSEPASDKRGAKADELTLAPLELIDRIAALVLPPRTHRHRYFGVLADVTPPVALAAFAAAGIARSEPMGTGMTAFRLSMGKALVPFAFVYSPSLLMIDFTWPAFTLATVCSLVAVMGLIAAYTGFVARPVGRVAFLALNILALSLIFANPWVAAVAVPGVLLILLWHARQPH